MQCTIQQTPSPRVCARAGVLLIVGAPLRDVQSAVAPPCQLIRGGLLNTMMGASIDHAVVETSIAVRNRNIIGGST